MEVKIVISEDISKQAPQHVQGPAADALHSTLQNEATALAPEVAQPGSTDNNNNNGYSIQCLILNSSKHFP